jgi:3-oxoacyl-[acyl-carrier-protein] synthase-1
MSQSRKAYLAGIGMITSVGDTVESVYAATRAGISRYASADYFTDDRQRMVLATVPDAALAELDERLALRGKLGFRDRRLLGMSHVAAYDAMRSYPATAPLPFVFAGPEVYPDIDSRLNDRFLDYFCEQTQLPIDRAATRMLHTGRPGAMDALKYAFHYLYDAGRDYVLIGAADSYQHSALLRFLDETARVKAQRTNANGGEDSFVPGEGACFLLVTRHPEAAIHHSGRRVALAEPGFGLEPGHLYSDEERYGEGLDAAFKDALAQRHDTAPIGLIYHSMNGERYWAKEFGVAMTRSSEHFDDPAIEHPAECFGDTGAASGALLIGLAHAHLMQLPGSALVCASADQGYRAAVCLHTEEYEP